MTRWRQALLNAAMGFAVLSFVILVSVYTESRVQAEEDKAIRFPDTALEWLIRKQIEKPEGPILATDIERLETLIVSHDQLAEIQFTEGFDYVHDLTGIEHLTRLQTLELRDFHYVQDFEPIGNLKSLRKLTVWGTTIGDLSPFATLTELRELSLMDTVVTDLEPIRGLNKLEVFWMGSNRLKNVSALEAMPNLKELSLYSWEEQKLDLDPIHGLTKLNLLHMPNKGIDQLDFLKAMPKLRSLDLRGNPIRDFTPLGELKDLTMLALSGETVEDLSFVKTLPNLKHLDVTKSRVRDVRPLAELSNLESLGLSENPIEDIAPLASLSNLKSLHLAHDPVKDLTSLSGLMQLEYLNLYETHVTSLRGVESLQRLREVNLRRNIVPVDSDLGTSALRDRIIAAGGTFEYDDYPSIPDIVLFVFNDRVYAGGTYQDLPAQTYVEASRTMVPLRFITEHLGATVEWEEGDRTVSVMGSGKSVRLTIDAYKAVSAGEELELDAPPRIVNGTTFVPLRFLAEYFGLKVNYYQQLGTVGLTAASAMNGAQEELSELQDRMLDYLQEIQDQNGIVVISGAVFDGYIELDFRKYGEHEKMLNHEEQSVIQSSIYRIVGTKFPLQLNQFVIHEDADIEGFIEEIDEKSNRLLIVNPDKTVGLSNNPEAVWITLTEDAMVLNLKEGERLQIGQRVRAWFAGIMITTYPGQTNSVKVEIIKAAAGS